MPKPPDIKLIPISKVPRERLAEWLKEPTNEEREYLRLKEEIEGYERDHDENPGKYERWEELRYRLSKDLQTFIETNLS